MVDDDAGQALEQLGVSLANGPDPVERAAVGHDEQVVGGRGIRVGAEAVHALDEVVQRRRWVGAHRVRPPTERLDDGHDAEGRPERVRIRVLVTDGEDVPGAAQALDDDLRHGAEEGRQVDGHRGGRPVGLR